MADKTKDQVLEWIRRTTKEAQEEYQEAEIQRGEKPEGDIDAIEASTFNDGIISVLNELELFVKSPEGLRAKMLGLTE